MEISKFEGRYNTLSSVITGYQEYTEAQKEKIKALLLTYPDVLFSSTSKSEKVVETSKFPVSKIKKWDVIFAKAGAVVIPHYHIVFKVTKDKVYCLTITSNKTVFADLEITKSRQLKGYVCNSLTILSLEEAKKQFVFVYDGSKKEIINIFNTIKKEINTI